MQIIITGIAALIGSYTAKKLVKTGYSEQNIDNSSNYYLIAHKIVLIKNYLNPLQIDFVGVNIENNFKFNNSIKKTKSDIVFNLAAQIGVNLLRTTKKIMLSVTI